MGIYRFVLALLVILFHFSHFSSLSGYTAVFGFYAISGYLMALILDKKYLDLKNGTLRFYVNRALKLYPVYLVVFVLTGLLIWVHGGSVFAVSYLGTEIDKSLLDPKIVDYGLMDYVSEAVLGLGFSIEKFQLPPALFLTGFPQIVPQSWSLTSEICFYLLAPALVILLRRRLGLFLVLYVCSVAYLLATFLFGGDFSTYRYRSFFGVLFIFLSGMMIYRYGHVLGKVPFTKTVSTVLVVTYVTILWVFRDNWGEVHVYSVLVIQLAIVFFLSRVHLKNKWAIRVDRVLGSASYSMFVGHKLAAFLVLILASELRSQFGGELFFGEFGSKGFVGAVLLVQGLISLALYFGIERRIESVRVRVSENVVGSRNKEVIE